MGGEGLEGPWEGLSSPIHVVSDSPQLLEEEGVEFGEAGEELAPCHPVGRDAHQLLGLERCLGTWTSFGF